MRRLRLSTERVDATDARSIMSPRRGLALVFGRMRVVEARGGRFRARRCRLLSFMRLAPDIRRRRFIEPGQSCRVITITIN